MIVCEAFPKMGTLISLEVNMLGEIITQVKSYEVDEEFFKKI